jgi:hydrogenase nickel incorporation protein HypA/HybF
MMHEYSVVQALLERVGAEARARRAIAVHRLTVRVGELAGLDAELFATAFSTFRAGTVCGSATLDVERVPVRWACPACGAVIPEGARLQCATCGAPARLEQGDEIVLGRIEMEVPDVQDLRLR